MYQIDGLIWLDVNTDCMCIFSCSFSVWMCYCTALSAVFDWICALQVFIIIKTEREREREREDLVDGVNYMLNEKEWRKIHRDKNLVNGVNYNEEKSVEAQNVGLRLQNFCRTVTVWKSWTRWILPHVTTHVCFCTWCTELYLFTDL